MMACSEQRIWDPSLVILRAYALQELVKSFNTDSGPETSIALFEGQFIAGPVLLAFAMELALKAWWAIEDQDRDIPKTHDLLKLFDGLSEESRTRLENAYPEVPGFHPQFPPVRPGLRSTLADNNSAFMVWRYLHEHNQADFPIGEFNEALSAVLEEFKQSHR